jgi:hypothetical protein
MRITSKVLFIVNGHLDGYDPKDSRKRKILVPINPKMAMDGQLPEHVMWQNVRHVPPTLFLLPEHIPHHPRHYLSSRQGQGSTWVPPPTRLGGWGGLKKSFALVWSGAVEDCHELDGVGCHIDRQSLIIGCHWRAEFYHRLSLTGRVWS